MNATGHTKEHILTNATRKGPRKNRLFSALLFFIGCIVGVMLVFGLDNLLCKKYLALEAGKLLDIDFVYSKAEKPMRGYIVSENERKIVLQTAPETTLILDRNEIRKIDYNYYARYLKQAW